MNFINWIFHCFNLSLSLSLFDYKVLLLSRFQATSGALPHKMKRFRSLIEIHRCSQSKGKEFVDLAVRGMSYPLHEVFKLNKKNRTHASNETNDILLIASAVFSDRCGKLLTIIIAHFR